MNLWFFMSYASVDDQYRDRSYVQKFFRDLKEEVASRTSDSQDAPIGFLDQHNLATGDPWPKELAGALRNCRTLVAVMTARYFESDHCGREWKIFEDRCSTFCDQRSGLQSPALILPVLWVPPEEGKFPSFASRLQVTFGLEDVADLEKPYVKDYGKKGLLHIIKRVDSSHGGAYETILESLAKRIITASKSYPLPPLTESDLPTLENVESRFAFTQITDAERHLAASRRANFVVFAAREPEMPQEVKEVPVVASRYAPSDALDWRPYYPDSEDRIGLLAQRQASKRDLICHWLPVGAGLVERLRATEKDKSVAIIVVDPWTATLHQYNKRLRELDQFQFKNCVVLVPWNLGDECTRKKQAILWESLETALSRRFALRSSVFLKDWISNISELEKEIGEALREIEEILAHERSPMRPVSTGRYQSPPDVAATRLTSIR